MAQPSRLRESEMPKSASFVPRTLSPCEPDRRKSRARRERDAKD
jgi:hypothetical protein